MNKTKKEKKIWKENRSNLARFELEEIPVFIRLEITSGLGDERGERETPRGLSGMPKPIIVLFTLQPLLISTKYIQRMK